MNKLREKILQFLIRLREKMLKIQEEKTKENIEKLIEKNK
jgi:hypothetical protein